MPKASEVLDFIQQAAIENEKRKRRNLYGDRLGVSKDIASRPQEKTKASEVLQILLSGVLDPIGTGLGIAEARGATGPVLNLAKFANDPLGTAVSKIDEKLKPPSNRHNFPPGEKGDREYENAVLTGKDESQNAFLPYLAKNNPVLKQMYRRVFGFSPATDPIVLQRAQKESGNYFTTRYEAGKESKNRGAVFAYGQPKSSKAVRNLDSWDSNYYDPEAASALGLGGEHIKVNPGHVFNNPLITRDFGSPGKGGGKSLLGNDFYNKVQKAIDDGSGDPERPYRIREKITAKAADRGGYDSVIGVPGRYNADIPIDEIMLLPKGQRTVKASTVGGKTKVMKELITKIYGREPLEELKPENPKDFMEPSKIGEYGNPRAIPETVPYKALNAYFRNMSDGEARLLKDINYSNWTKKTNKIKDLAKDKEATPFRNRVLQNIIAETNAGSGFNLHQVREKLRLTPKTLREAIERALDEAGLPSQTTTKKLPIPD